MIVLFGAGFALILIFNLANASVQTLTPDDLRGRVMSIYSLVFFGVMPIGSLIVGWMASQTRRAGERSSSESAAILAFATADVRLHARACGDLRLSSPIRHGDRHLRSRTLSAYGSAIRSRRGALPIDPEDSLVESVAARVQVALVLGPVETQQLGLPRGLGFIERHVSVVPHVDRLGIADEQGGRGAGPVRRRAAATSVGQTMVGIRVIAVGQEDDVRDERANERSEPAKPVRLVVPRNPPGAVDRQAGGTRDGLPDSPKKRQLARCSSSRRAAFASGVGGSQKLSSTPLALELRTRRRMSWPRSAEMAQGDARRVEIVGMGGEDAERASAGEGQTVQPDAAGGPAKTPSFRELDQLVVHRAEADRLAVPELGRPVDVVPVPEDVLAAAAARRQGRPWPCRWRPGRREARMPMSSTIRGWSLAMQSQSLVTWIRKLRKPDLAPEMALDVEGVFGHFLLDPLGVLVPADLDRAVLADDEALAAADALRCRR